MNRKKSKKNANLPIPDKVIFRGKEFNPNNFINRDFSWLEFNSRVLNEAIDTRTPLLMRLMFCDIFRSNNDEFFMKRIGALHNRINDNDMRLSLDGKTPIELHQNLREKVIGMIKTYADNFEKKLVPALEKEGVQLLKYSDISVHEKKYLLSYFKKNIFPILTPLAVDSGHPFPFLSNLSKSIGVSLRKPRSKEKHFARVKIPTDIDQWIQLKSNKNFEYRFISTDEVIRENLQLLFSGMIIEATTIFRVARNAASQADVDEAEDLMELVEEDLRERRIAPIVRLEYEKNFDQWILNFLIDELELSAECIYEMPSIVNFTKLSQIIDINRPHLKYKKLHPKTVPGLEHIADQEFNIFNAIRKKDYIAHFPYQSFTSSVETFLQTAVNDPKVKAIKIVLYRTDSDGKLIKALIRAAENGKQVACIIELKARFDEANNIHWAQKLEEAGVHVTYGLLKYKTHAKLLMVVRQDHDGIRTYCHIGTGNFNSTTSKLYTDLSYFTCKKNIGEEVMEVFNFLTGRSLKYNYKKLLVAPFNMFKEFIKMIERETYNAKKGRPAEIIAKMNQLEDPEIIEKLYEASSAGVKIQLIVRGFCSLRPGIKGLSDNIKVYSLVGRLLEHSRIYYFRNAKENPEEGDVYIGSADWMHRNLFDRVEVITPIAPKEHRAHLYEYMQLILKDNRHLWQLQSNGTYKQRETTKKENVFNSQQEMINRK